MTQIDLSATLATNNDQYLFQPIENHAQDGRYVLREDGVIQTLMARMGTGGGECASDPPVLFREERRGSFVGDKVSSTVLVCNSKDVILFQRKEGPPPVNEAYGVDCRNGCLLPERTPTLQAVCGKSLNGGGTIMRHYLVRRLMPVECARLQGMPDDWCSKVPHKDTPEYKLWGNGMALPCILYMMEGAAEVIQRRNLSRLLGG